MVQRYELKEDCVTGHIDLEEDMGGGWVRYEDYAKLEALYAAAIELMVSVHRRYNTDASPALQELYEKASDANEPRN